MSGTLTEPWWQRAVVYQVYPRSFADTDGDGVGDLRGITAHVDHLAWLGVDVVWLSPVYPSPMADNGYDISDYEGIDPLFGTLEDFDELVAQLHARGIRLVMDLVVNHTSDRHPWFLESRSSADSPKRDWYWWRPPRPGTVAGTPGAEPTNWGSFFSGPTWTYDVQTGDYYLHVFAPEQPELNWEHPPVREAVHRMMRWWLDRGVDGFRMDVINFISKDPALPDSPPRPGSPYADGTAAYIGGPRLHEFLREMQAAVTAGRPDVLLTVGEMPGVTVEQARVFTDPARAEVDMVFQFEHVMVDQGDGKWDARPLDLRRLKASLARWQVGLADVGWNSLYWDNHDQPRAVSRFGDDGVHRVASAKLLATVLHLHRGTPYVYQGEELGMTNVPFAGIADFRDVESLNHYAEAVGVLGRPPAEVLDALRHRSRDNARTPMQWDDSPHAGFTTGTPWIPVHPNHTEVNVAAAMADPGSVLHHHRRLIELRHADDTVVHGRYALLLPEHEQVYAFTRTLGDDVLLVLANFSGDEVDVPLEDAEAWAGAELVLGNLDGEPGPGLRLRPWEALVLRRR